MASQQIMIVGGGIAGLTTALALRQRGIDAHVHEAAPILRAAGAGIVLSPNAMRVLDALGLGTELRDLGWALERGELHDARAGRLSRMDLRQIAERHGAPSLAIHRATLAALLASRIPTRAIHHGRALGALRRVDTDGTLELTWSDGTRERARTVIGADGLHSPVRRYVAPEARVRYSGQVSYRGLAALAERDTPHGVSMEIWDAGRRFGYVRLGPHDVYWYATLDEADGPATHAGTDHGHVTARFADLAAPVPALLATTPADGVLRLPMHDLVPPARWHRDGAVLIGDAAHATTPNLGQGGAQAIEDAWVLANELARLPKSPAQAFAAYQRIRERKARLIVRRSRTIGTLAHLRHPLLRAARNALLRLTPASATARQLDAVFALAFTPSPPAPTGGVMPTTGATPVALT